MKKLLLLIAVVLMTVSCRGYSDKSEPLSPEEMQLSDMATTLKDEAHAIQEAAPAILEEPATSFSEAALRFQNLCLRYGSNSLEARKAFDQVMFFEAQISQSQELASSPDFNKQWQSLRSGTLHELARKLGYRPEKLQE